MKLKSALCLLLALVLLAGMTVCTAEAEYPSYLNLDSYYPLVNEGEDVTVRIVTLQSDGYGFSDPYDYWFFAWLKQKMNLNMDIEMIPEGSWDERKALLFAGGDLPDLLLCCALSASDLVTYGESNAQLLDMTPYITPELMPDMYAWIEKYPTLRPAVSCANGGFYSIPSVNRCQDIGDVAAWFFIRTTWLEEVGIEAPTTLDEFVDMLRAFKAMKPDSIPLGGGYGSDSAATASSAPSPFYAILNALGYVTKDAYGLSPALKGDKVVIPAADADYKVLLETMKTLYDEELVSKDMFTMDQTQFDALALDDKFGAMGYVPYLCLPETFGEWECLQPLTSAYSDVKQWGKSDFYGTGNYAISADTKYPELLCRLGSWLFSDDGTIAIWGGPQTKNEEDTLGMVGGWYIDPETKLFKQKDVVDGKQDNNWVYYLNECYPNGSFCSVGNLSRVSLENQELGYKLQWERDGFPETTQTYDPGVGDHWYRLSQMEKVADYAVEVYPTKVFFPDETNTRISDLRAVIDSYVRAETAKFITGARSLDEFDAYLEELNALGLEEYLGYYVDYYEAYKANMG